MAGEGNPNGILPTREIKQREPIKPSVEAWKAVRAQGIAGNLTFPQAFFAQGILMGNEMSRRASQEGFPVWQFVTESPPDNLILPAIDQARIKAHARHGVTLALVDPEKAHRNVWEKDTRQAQTFLTNVAHSIYVDRNGHPPESMRRLATYGPPPQKDRVLLENAQDDPLFQAVLASAASGIKQDAVRPGLSDPYIDLINEFMQKYNPKKWQDAIPDDYQASQEELKDNLNEHIVKAARIVTRGIIDTVETSFPDHTRLLAQLKEEAADDESVVDLFGMPRIVAPDPLKLRVEKTPA